jgi:hypothetical protein
MYIYLRKYIHKHRNVKTETKKCIYKETFKEICINLRKYIYVKESESSGLRVLSENEVFALGRALDTGFGTQFTCFTTPEVQILTPEALSAVTNLARSCPTADALQRAQSSGVSICTLLLV